MTSRFLFDAGRGASGNTPDEPPHRPVEASLGGGLLVWLCLMLVLAALGGSCLAVDRPTRAPGQTGVRISRMAKSPPRLVRAIPSTGATSCLG